MRAIEMAYTCYQVTRAELTQALRVQERGAMKEHEFSKRLEQLWAAEQRLRIPVAQGLPWTTDEPKV